MCPIVGMCPIGNNSCGTWRTLREAARPRRPYSQACGKGRLGMGKTNDKTRKRWGYCDELSNIVDFIESEMPELLRDADGSTIRVGDMMYRRWVQLMHDRNREIWTEDDND